MDIFVFLYRDKPQIIVQVRKLNIAVSSLERALNYCERDNDTPDDTLELPERDFFGTALMSVITVCHGYRLRVESGRVLGFIKNQCYILVLVTCYVITI